LRVQGLGFRALSLGFRVQGSEFRVEVRIGYRDKGLGFRYRDKGSGFWALGAGIKVWGVPARPRPTRPDGRGGGPPRRLEGALLRPGLSVAFRSKLLSSIMSLVSFRNKFS